MNRRFPERLDQFFAAIKENAARTFGGAVPLVRKQGGRASAQAHLVSLREGKMAS